MKYVFLIAALFCMFNGWGQRHISGIIADSNTRQPLPFATIQSTDGKASVIAEIGGSFSLNIPPSVNELHVSYVSHRGKSIYIHHWINGDTIFLPSAPMMNEVVIHSQGSKIRRIINSAIRNKPVNNPEFYDHYECFVYYKMFADINSTGQTTIDSIARASMAPREKRRDWQNDPEIQRTDSIYFGDYKHLILSETYSKRSYRRPQQVQELVIASRFSGLDKTYFSNVVTNMLPFHVYTDFISLGGKDYSNPIAKGWQQRYVFALEDEILMERDTVFQFSFHPKSNTNFNGLTGLIYINSHGYAISHIIAGTDTTKERYIQFEQIYTRIQGRWFPKELNYDMVMRHSPTPQSQFIWNGHSVIDSVSFEMQTQRFDKARSVKLDDSVDLHSAKEWETYRKGFNTTRDSNTYVFMDSVGKEIHLDRFIQSTGRLPYGRFPLGKIDLDINHILAFNSFEGTRFGAGFYTNDEVSKYYSMGGWINYGTKDKNWKYGASFTGYLKGNKDNTVSIGYEKNYKNPAEVNIHPELSKNALKYWQIGLVDQYKAFTLNLDLRKDYWQIRPSFVKQIIQPLYPTDFRPAGKPVRIFNNEEVSIGLRYAYGEKRILAFGYYSSAGTKYPVVYLRMGAGRIDADDYGAKYLVGLGAIKWDHHINRWGKDWFWLEGGVVHELNSQPLPRSFLLSGNGSKVQGINFYTEGGFMTMHPYDFYNDRYVSFFYKHDFDRYLWETKFSKPYISLAHNMGFGSMSPNTMSHNPGLRSFAGGYHETGILFNQMIRRNLHFSDLNLGGGYFYHWTNQFSRTNGTWVLGFNLSF
jgi:hypothetical protein